MSMHFSIVKVSSRGEERYVFRPSRHAPNPESNEEVVVSIDCGNWNPSAKERSKIFKRLRRIAREKNIAHVANLDTR